MIPVPAGVVQRPAAAPSAILEKASGVTVRSGIIARTDTLAERKIGRYTLTGLGVGAAVGIIGGAFGSRYAGCGCSDAEKTLGFAVWFGAIGAGAGTVVGAVTGALHDHRR